MEPIKLIDILSEEVKELKYFNDNLKSLNDTLSKEIQSIENRLVAAEQEKTQLESHCRHLQAKIDIIIEEKEAEIHEFKENCAQHIEAQKRLDKSLNSHKKQLNEVKDVLVQAREETERIRKELELARKREKELRHEIGHVQHNLESEIVKNEELREELEDYRSTNKAMKEEIDHLKKEKEAITQKMVRKENDYEDMKTILSYGGDLNFSNPLPGADVCSEIFDKDNLTESRLNLVNLIHPIDTSLEHLSPIVPPNNMLNRYRQSGSPITSTERKQPIRVRFDIDASMDEIPQTPTSTTFSATLSTIDEEKPQFGPFCFLFITFILFCYTLVVYPLKYTYHYLIATILLPGIKVERITSCQ
ncbi:cilia- and flagella-associated protein 58-like [Panonychus citri]|uniref:cilia- and flagella-associated protein 58-like n=1 Tax=Panonychus citri TaxID=50023 RepID=UPI002307BF4B|nr:cilia- and flagella-associated protein 58-like [Panonychus citri]